MKVAYYQAMIKIQINRKEQIVTKQIKIHTYIVLTI